jgi:hypothetical protein
MATKAGGLMLKLLGLAVFAIRDLLQDVCALWEV